MTSKNTTGSKATIAIVLVTSLFFIWGLTMNLVNALNSPFANYIELSSAEASLLQVAYYGAYFVMAIPAGLIAKRFGYKGGVISGLLLFALGGAPCHQHGQLRPVPVRHVRYRARRGIAGDQLQSVYHQAG